MDSLPIQSTNQPATDKTFVCGTTSINTKNRSTTQTTFSARRPSAPPIVIHIVDPVEDLEAGAPATSGIIVPATPRGLSGRDNHFPIVIAVPMGDAQDEGNDDDGTLSDTSTLPKPPPSHLTSPKWSLEESTPKFRRTLTVLCGGTALLFCATVGILVAKSFRDHEDTIPLIDDHDGWR